MNNEVKAQIGYTVPGTGLPPTLYIEGAEVDGAGRWYGMLRVTNTVQACLRDGVVVAQAGQPLWPGSSEEWAPTRQFVLNHGDINGDYFVVGDAGTFPSWVPTIVHNGTEILWRSGDQVDVDDNGVYDDQTTFTQLIGPGEVDDAGGLTIQAWLYNSATGANGISLVRLSPGPPRLELLNLVAGQTTELKVVNAEPGAYVYSGYSLHGAGPTPVASPWGTLPIALTQPFVELPVLVADAQGVASYSQTLPANAVGLEVWTHAFVWQGASVWLTNAVSGVVQ